MRRIVAGVAAAAALLSLPIAATAGHCSSAIVIFSRTQAQKDAGIGAVNPNAFVCAAAEAGAEPPADTRVLMPLAAEISIRYTRDLGAGVGQLTASVSGLGFAGATVTLPRYVDGTTGLASYASAFVRIPNGEIATGSVRVRIDHSRIPGGSDTVCFRTWDASC